MENIFGMNKGLNCEVLVCYSFNSREITEKSITSTCLKGWLNVKLIVIVREFRNFKY